MKNKGFTFVELLVVITIIAVIFAAGVVSYASIGLRSRDSRRKADLEAIRQSLEMCRTIAGEYPADIYTSHNGYLSVVCTDTSETVTMKSTPLDPKPCEAPYDDGLYTYVYPTADGGYTLTANCMEGDGSNQVTNP